MVMKGKLYIGTSGWQYRHWKGTFYPDNLPGKGQFAYYATRFNTVEINNSFYKLPTEENFSDWKQRAPEGFIYSVKAPRFFTQAKKLLVSRDDLIRFITRCEILGNKLGVILFQLPPRWKVNPQRLEDFIKNLPRGLRYVFEFREPGWYDDRVYQVLRHYGCGFCIYELAGHLSPETVTADFVYIRLHGPGEKYQGSYPAATLRKWKRKAAAWQTGGRDVYIYFDNDEAGYAPANAQQLLAKPVITNGSRD